MDRIDITSHRIGPSAQARRRTLAVTAVLAGGLLLQAAVRAAGAGAKPVTYRGEAEALFAQDGRPAATAFEPPPGLALRSRAGLYATPEQLAWQAANAEAYTVVVDLDGRGPLRWVVERALRDHRWAAVHAPEATGIATFVRSASAQRAVNAADVLTASGVPLVFVVVDPARAMAARTTAP